jgi:hypothetical protein
MIRFITAIYVLGALVVNLLFQSDVSLKMEAAPRIIAGTEILVKISLKKSDLSGFCRFQQELPAGFSATSVSTSNADFTFKDQKVRFIWLKLPEDEEIEISYKITCDERLKGSINLNGKFSFIEENERKSVDVSPQLLTIVPSPNMNPTMLVDVNDFGKEMPAGIASTNYGMIACVRQKPMWVDGQNEYIVNLLVNKDQLQKFAKIEENVPKGFTALNVNSRDGIFTFKDGKAKFLWMSLPADPYFVVSYKLVPVNGVDPQAASMLINGAFSYIIDDKTQSIDVFEKDADLTNIKPGDLALLLRPDAKTQLASVPQQQTMKASAQTELVAATNVANKMPVDTPKNNVKPAVEKELAVVNPPVNNIINTPVKKVEETESLSPESHGIYYRVQIAAGHKPVDIKAYFKKFRLEKSIVKEDHNGWIKYSVGSFGAYMEARDYRVHLWNTTPITDAFVSAYNEGNRITIQEALMITNQKWIK